MHLTVNFNSCRIVKHNQVQRMRILGCSIQPRDVIKFNVYEDKDEGQYVITDRRMSEDTFHATKNKNGRKTKINEFDELTIYEHQENFETYHPTLNDLKFSDPLDVTRELSSGYRYKVNDKLTINILYFYFIDLDRLGGTKSELDSRLCDAILAYAMEDADIAGDEFQHYNINIITNSAKTSDNIIKRIEPHVNSAPGINMYHIPFHHMLLSARTHVLSPQIKSANPETVELIKRELKYNDSVFGSILVNDPLIVDHGLSIEDMGVGKVIQIDKPDGYRYFRRIIKGRVNQENIG